MKDDNKNLTLAKESLENEIERLKETFENKKDKINNYNFEIKELKEYIDENNLKMKNLMNENEEIKGDNEKLKNILKEYEKEFEEMDLNKKKNN